MKKGYSAITALSPYGAQQVVRGDALMIKTGRSGFHDIVELAHEQESGPPLAAVVPDDWMLVGVLNQ